MSEIRINTGEVSNVEGIFYAGTITAPKNIGESINEGTAAALAAAEWISKQ